jgi:hypothetical protein
MLQPNHSNLDQGNRPGFLQLRSTTHCERRAAQPTRHLDQQRKNVRSTKKKARPNDKEVKEFVNDDDTNPITDATTNMAYATILDLDDETNMGKSYSDLTGRFPAKSQQGNLYILILYTYNDNDNAILAEPLKTRSDADQLKAYEAILKSKRGHCVDHALDGQ